MASTTQQAAQQETRAATFAARWQGRGNERSDTAPFWLGLLADVFGVSDPSERITFERPVIFDNGKSRGRIDVLIEGAQVLVEQKSLGIDLDKAEQQSDGQWLTPFQQAKRYDNTLPYNRHCRWIVTCNFAEFRIHDMQHPQAPPLVVRLDELASQVHQLAFLVDDQATARYECDISLQAGELVGRLYDALLPRYHNPSAAETQRALNILCVRLVFCLYAEDAGVFGRRDLFLDYLRQFPAQRMRKALDNLFRALDTPPQERDPYMADDDPLLAAFPYVNGGLFRDQSAEIPPFDEALRELLVEQASAHFDWSGISPTIFGAVFESTLNPETRRAGGMHYTSVENIHKVIDPLFLDDLRQQLRTIKRLPVLKERRQQLLRLQQQLGTLRFLDPACGSGNFLTETYLSLRRLENDIIKERFAGERQLNFDDEDSRPIHVSISQFSGIEINDFAVTVAKTALWIAEAQMLRETESLVDVQVDFLPIHTSARIVEGNALRLDWLTLEGGGDVLAGPLFAHASSASAQPYDYIIGNPPFVGFTYTGKEQKEDMQLLFPGIKNLDYVCGWFKKAADLIRGTNTRCCFVSTNSIAQGETVARFWPFFNMRIDFAYRTFRWDSESTQKAHVHCVIIGFSDPSAPATTKLLFEGDKVATATNINAYLFDAPDILVTSRNKPLCGIPQMVYGNKPADGGHLIIEDAEHDEFVRREPEAVKYIRPLLGAEEFIKRKRRWCLWLVDAPPNELRKMPLVMERIRLCKEMRERSIAAAIRRLAATPTLFAQITQPMGVDYILVPCTSSERRAYVPMGFMSADTICSNAVLIIPSATLYHFGVLTSRVHMAWMRAVCGRLKSDYRYSKDIVYNNFPWPAETAAQEEAVARTAQAILDARNLFPDASLADLYDALTMPPALLHAHEANDRAVCRLYGLDPAASEPDIVAHLMNRYQALSRGTEPGVSDV